MEGTPIPQDWREAVVSILREGDNAKIEWTLRAMQEWQAATLSAFAFEAQLSMANTLANPSILGQKVELPENGETYAFFFSHDSKILYGKICLRPSKVEIKIISAHTPRKGNKLS